MTISNKNISFTFKVTGVEGNSFDSITRQNVRKRVENILYLESPSHDAVRLDYVGSEELNPTNNLYIGDRSDQLFVNSRTTAESEFQSDIFPISLATKNFLVTQELVQADSGWIPLYYKHTIDALPENITGTSIRVLDKDSNLVGDDKYKIVLEKEYDDATGSPKLDSEGNNLYTQYDIYNNLENTIDDVTGEYEIYFIQYTESVSGASRTKTILLNNEKAYREATFEDIWSLTSELKPWARAYLLTDSLSLSLPKSARYNIRYEENKRIKIDPPVAYGDEEPWFVKIQNGAFTNSISGLSSTYSIPEFINQNFYPTEPYGLASGLRCKKIDKNLLLVPNEELVFGVQFTPLDILILNPSGSQLYAITSDSTKDGDDFIDTNGSTVILEDGSVLTWSSSELLGVDRRSGFVHLSVNLLDTYAIFATYSFEVTFYELTSLNMNPVFDPQVHKQTRAVYIVPQSLTNSNIGTQTASLMWIKINDSGTVESINQDGAGGNENLNSAVSLVGTEGYKLNGILGLHYNWRASTTITTAIDFWEASPYDAFIEVDTTFGFPVAGWLRAKDSSGNYRYMKYDGITSDTFILSLDPDDYPYSTTIPLGNEIELVNFVDERSTASLRVLTDEAAAVAVGVTPSVYSQYFILGDMSINPSHGIADAVVYDVREDGGGIIPKKYEEAKTKNAEVQWTNDFSKFDGQVYPGNAVVICKLPSTLLETFSLEKIKDAATDNVPFGVLPLIQFYGHKANIIKITQFGTNLAIEWEKSGEEFVYDIWYSESEAGPYTRHNDYLIFDDTVLPNNLYIISGLDDKKHYYIKIDIKDRYYKWWYSYTADDSIDGSGGLDENPPTAPFGNVQSFQFEIV